MSVLKFKDPVTKEWKEITTIIGPQGIPGPKGTDGSVSFADLTEEQKASLKGDKGDKGDQGEPGADYVLTVDDKSEIAQLVLADMPQAEDGEY